MKSQLSLSFLSVILVFSTQAHAKLTVHEWGTFTSLVGSDGKAQNGMYYEDEVLPDFVHDFGVTKRVSLQAHRPMTWAPLQQTATKARLCPGSPKVPCEFLVDQIITQKMETPVVYFYADKPQRVSFAVSFPGGIISQSFPAASVLLPEATPGVELKNGFAHYDVDILKDAEMQPPFVDSSNIYSHARNVGSDLIRVGNETEKFIFYRGLGEFRTKLLTTSSNGRLTAENTGSEKIPAAFLVSTDGTGRGGILELGEIDSQDSADVSARKLKALQSKTQPQASFLPAARKLLTKSLTQAGLHDDEAKAMIDTWENGYFKTPGLRILYVLSRQEVEAILPVRISPEPDELTRAFVGRIEILLDTDEERVLEQIMQQGDGYDVNRLGRMAQPILLRVRDLARSNGVLTSELSATIDELIARIP